MLVFGSEVLFWRRLDMTAPSETGIKAAARELADTRTVKMVQRMNLVLMFDIMLTRFLLLVYMMYGYSSNIAGDVLHAVTCHREASQVMIAVQREEEQPFFISAVPIFNGYREGPRDHNQRP